MKKNIGVTIADPAGDTTIFVHDRFDRRDYAAVANQLLKMKFDGKMGEQVSFILDCPTCGRAQGKMEMCGLEFCGNASRSFALMKAKEFVRDGLTPEGLTTVSVDVSGVNEILDIEVDTLSSYTKIKMPSPVRIFDEVIFGTLARIVDFGGIMHIVLKDIEASRETFDRYRDYINERYNPPAMGVMFWDTVKKQLTPVVYVSDVDTTYFEGSCGSGSTACAVAFGMECGIGEHRFTFAQPAGAIEASCIIKKADPLSGPAVFNGLELEKVFIEGPVWLSEEYRVEIEIQLISDSQGSGLQAQELRKFRPF